MESHLMEYFALRNRCGRTIGRHPALLIVALLAAASAPLAAQSPSPAPGMPAAAVRRLSMDDAVRLALEQNLGIRIERINPQIQDIGIMQSRAFWAPNFTSNLASNSQNNPPTSALSGGQSRISDSRVSSQIGMNQLLPTGGNYSFGWNSARATSSNIFNNLNPLISSNVTASVNQPLLRNFRIDNIRQLVALARKDRESSDVQLNSTIAVTERNVKNAYWDLAFQIANLQAQQQSLDLAKRLLADNEKRVQIGTMAPIDIVEAQSEVARNEETVIVAEAAIKQAEDRLRALIFDPASPDFWTTTIEPSDTMPFEATTVDTDAAVRRALANRTDLQLAKNSLSRDNISLKFLRNQSLPDISAQATYTSNAVGGTLLSPLSSLPLDGGDISRTVLSRAGYGSVLGDVVSSAFPTWTVGLAVSYPLGTSTAEADLARARLQHSQAEVQLRNLELQMTTQVRDAARQVQTNVKRVGSARAARDLAERRLEAEEKKFAAGIQISFFVFQAQRDLSQARTTEIRAIADYNKSLVDFEAIQETPLTGTVGVTSATTGTGTFQR
jgi:outer membrane protein